MSESRFDFDHPNIKYLDKRWDTETVVKQMHFTAGILLGRTTIEGWMCGKDGWIYDVDSSGNILSKKLHPVPADVAKFNSKSITAEIIEEYKKILE
jgi:hypothetical protein